MTKIYELPNDRTIMADVDEKHHTATVDVYALDDLVREVNKTGHWIMSDDEPHRPICDNCGEHPWKGYIPTVEEATERFKFCPNCGAKMTESEEI